MHSWAAIWADRCGRAEVAGAVLSAAALSPFEVTHNGITGYQPEYASDPSGDYPGATPTIWSEGTFFTGAPYERRKGGRGRGDHRGHRPGEHSGRLFRVLQRYVRLELTPSQCVIGPRPGRSSGQPRHRHLGQ